ncbi:dimethylaniline monooxygenase 2 [Leptodontidium sp. 2 PMI_412]|nr:dimethylaniline monooxygenase 2 [Leptodontidium sp. 2 PMI_412]
MTGMPKVAVIGAGVLGLTALKNLLEEGFDATAFDKNDYVGGLWRFTEDGDTTSATENTQWNSCSQMSCYTDFPFPPGTPDFPTLAQIQSYLEGYCKAFSLGPHIKLRHTVKHVTRQDDMWSLEYVDMMGAQHEERFDKVIMAVGQTGKRVLPLGISGLENFKGRVLHGQSFKRAADFKDKNVLVLGSSNIAMDCAVDLCGHAKKIYLSHRHGGVIIPRYYEGAPAEFSISLRMQALGRVVGNIAPSRWAMMFNRKCLAISNDSFGSLPRDWRFNILPEGQMCNPIINDKIIDMLRKGQVSVVQTMRSVLKSGEIELVSEEVLSDVDTIILCTGYKYDYSLLPGYASPIRDSNRQWEACPASSGRPLPKLYQGIFSLDYPDSLAFLGVSGYPSSQMPLNDLIAMAIAQIWKGAYDLPSRAEMESEVDSRHRWLIEMATRDGPSILPGRVKVGPWMQWLHKAAGTGVNDNLGYGWRGWLFWLKCRSFCQSLMNGINSPHLWRLFEGRRRKWAGAKEALIRVNEDAKSRPRSTPLPVK